MNKLIEIIKIKEATFEILKTGRGIYVVYAKYHVDVAPRLPQLIEEIVGIKQARNEVDNLINMI